MLQAVYLINVIPGYVSESGKQPLSRILICYFIKIAFFYYCKLFSADGTEEAWPRAGTDQFTWCWLAPWV